MENKKQLHSLPQRAVALAYGLFCHLAFLSAVAAMAIALFTGLRIGQGSFHGWASILANGALLATFPITHSWLLSPKGRRFMARLVPLDIGAKISMTVFVTISSLQLLAVFLLWSPSGIVWWQASGGTRIAIGMAAAGAWLLLGKSMADAQLSLQLGLVGWWAVFRNRKALYEPFSTRGLYRYVRQPIYISFALLLWLTSAWTPDQLVLAVAWTGYCVVGSALKEMRFIRYFGDAFRHYQKQVPFWIPAIQKAPSTSQTTQPKTDVDAIIIGAGPIGLLLANLMGKRGLRVLVAERRTELPTGSMAIGITPPSLKILKELSLDQEFVDQGIPITNATVFENGDHLGNVDFSRLPSEHQCILSLPQSETITLLRKNLKKFPSVVLVDGMQFIAQENGHDSIHVRLQDVESSAYSEYTASYLVGCDGHRSAVRQHAGIRFPGGTYKTQFLMADFNDLTLWGSEARLFFGTMGSVEAFPLSGGRRRWITQIHHGVHPERMDIGATIVQHVAERTQVDLASSEITFESFFRPRRHLASTYVCGRILLCGDAAHVMSPIGGQGMNTGFADAAHLDRALAAALEAPEQAARLFAVYTRTRRLAFNIAASRAARGMWLGTRSGRPLSIIRQIFIQSILFRPSIRERLATYFAMLTIPGNNPFEPPYKVPVQ